MYTIYTHISRVLFMFRENFRLRRTVCARNEDTYIQSVSDFLLPYQVLSFLFALFDQIKNLSHTRRLR